MRISPLQIRNGHLRSLQRAGGPSFAPWLDCVGHEAYVSSPLAVWAVPISGLTDMCISDFSKRMKSMTVDARRIYYVSVYIVDTLFV